MYDVCGRICEIERYEPPLSFGHFPRKRGQPCCSATLPAAHRLLLHPHPLVVGRDVLADDVEEEVASGVAEEFELLLQVFDDVVEVAVGAEVVAEVAVFGVEFDDTLCVVDDGGEFASVTDYASVVCEFFEFLVGEGCHSADFEAMEKLRWCRATWR